MASRQCEVSRSFEATADNTLSLSCGEMVELVSDANSDWWYVKSASGKEGYFPSTCLIRLFVDSSPAEKCLPPGWQKHFDPENRPYYFNSSMNKTQWSVPLEATDDQRPFSAAATSFTNEFQKEHVSPSKAGGHIIKHSTSLPIVESPTEFERPSRKPNLTPPSFPGRKKSTPTTTVNSPPPAAGSGGRPNKPPPPPPRKRAGVTVGEVERGKTASKDPEVFQYFKMSDDLKEEISRFSIRGYAEEHFKTKKKWGLFGRKAIKNSERNMGYSSKLAKPLTVMPKTQYKSALNMFQGILKFMDKGGDDDDSRGTQLIALIRDNDQLGMLNNGLLEELYCQLIQQTTDNPNSRSLERGWEAIVTLVLVGFLPEPNLLNVLIGHADLYRFQSNATGSFSLIVHSALCCHVKSLKETNSYSKAVHFPALCDVSYENDVIPLRSMFVGTKIFGSGAYSTIYREMFLKDQDLVFPLPSSLNEAVPEILKLMCCYILENGGRSRSGIFREAANTEIVKELLQQLEVGNYSSLFANENQKVQSHYSQNKKYSELIGDQNKLQAAAIPINDVLIVADILKIWFRKMPEPITTFALYDMCIKAGLQESEALALDIVDRMPRLNASILRYLARFLRELSETGHITNMETVNLSLVFAPNCIQSPNPDPQLFASNANYERKCFKLFIDVLAPES